MKLFDNITNTVKSDLLDKICHGSRISIAAATFSIYAFDELRKQLLDCEDFRFIFSFPSFVTENSEKERKTFYIQRLQRERSLTGTEFEVRLANELKQKTIAKECADWIRRKAQFKANTTRESINQFLTIQNSEESFTYNPFNSFTSSDLGVTRGNAMTNIVIRIENPESEKFLQNFNEIWKNPNKLKDVTEDVIRMISTAYEENAPELIYFATLYNIFNEFLADVSEDVLPNEATGLKNTVIWNKLFHFQKDAAVAIIHKLELYNGCILADSVGLGKTFTALAVIKYFEGRNKNVLVLCPKKLSENWMTFRGNQINNPLASDKLRFDIAYHTDLSRESGKIATGLSIESINWGNYDLVVIDESHNFRNGNGTNSRGGEKENRYMRLISRIIKPGVKTKVLMLSATPVNNRFYDLRNQLALAYLEDPEAFNKRLATKNSIDEIFRQAQAVYNAWCKYPEKERTTANLLRRLNFDFFEVLDSVTIARSRKQIQNYYDMQEIGAFPVRNKPVSLTPKLTDLENAITYHEIFERLQELQFTFYTPLNFVQKSKLSKYLGEKETETFRKGRELGIRRLTATNLLKRTESSIHSFLETVREISRNLNDTLQTIEQFEKNGAASGEITAFDGLENTSFDEDDQSTDFFYIGKKASIDLRDMDYLSWKYDIEKDLKTFAEVERDVENISAKHDSKLNELKHIIRKKISNPINPGNKKILIFTAFSDTAEYLFENLSGEFQKEIGLNIALVTGSINGRSTIPNFKADINHVLAAFSPKSKDRNVLYPNDTAEIDILIATDCISEGQNLQDCDTCINYDIHWNPVRIVQRFGRIDRIGSQNKSIQLINFWPDLDLDEYINLKERVETRMRISVMTASGDDDLINQEEKGDLEYRKKQLKKLKEEVVDLEDMESGISIMDLGLNEFRMDLLDFIKKKSDLDHLPFGIYAVAKGETPSVIFVLKSVNKSENIQGKNRLHPFYLVYVNENGEVLANHLQPKEILDKLRLIAKGKSSPDTELCESFNRETKSGRDMSKISALLKTAMDSIVQKTEDSSLNDFLDGEQVSFLKSSVQGLDDFELVCFMVVR